MPMRATGVTSRDSRLRRIKDRLTGASFRPSGMVPSSCMQPVARIHDQGSRPSCVGQSIAAAVENLHDSAQYVSSVNIWWGARRREGTEGQLVGTQLWSGVEEVCRRGWDPYDPDEDSDFDAAFTGPRIDEELFANSTKRPTAKRYRIQDGNLQQVVEALQLGYGVVFGAGVTDRYMDLSRGDFVAGPGWLDGSAGHAQRIYGFDARLRVFCVQNSWGTTWGGYYDAYGDYKGCTKIEAELLLASAWDIYALDVR